MSNTKRFTVNFALEKETKGAVRYEEVDENGRSVQGSGFDKIGTLYVRKTAFGPLGFPKVLQLEVTYQED